MVIFVEEAGVVPERAWKPVVRETLDGFQVGQIKFMTFGEAVKNLQEYTFIPISRENEPLR